MFYHLTKNDSITRLEWNIGLYRVLLFPLASVIIPLNFKSLSLVSLSLCLGFALCMALDLDECSLYLYHN